MPTGQHFQNFSILGLFLSVSSLPEDDKDFRKFFSNDMNLRNHKSVNEIFSTVESTSS